MKKGANAPESVLFKRVIKKRKKRANKASSEGRKFKWVTAPKPKVPEKKSFKNRLKNLFK
jgi:hypothetical protein